MLWSRSRSRLLLFAALLAQAAFLCSGTPRLAVAYSTRLDVAPAGADPSITPITDLRAAGRYAQALALARRQQADLLAEGQAPAWQLADATRLVATLELAEALPDSARREMAAADSLESVIESLRSDGIYRQAKDLAARQLEVRRRHLGEDHPDVAASLSALVVITLALGDVPLAHRYATEALDLRRRALGEKHPRVAESLVRLASVMQYRLYYDEALELNQQALALCRELPGDLRSVTAEVLQSLGAIHLAMQEDAAARIFFLESLAIRRQIFPGDHPAVAQSLGSLARVCIQQGEWTVAESYAREGLAIHRRLPSAQRAGLGRAVTTLAGILMHEKRYAEAEQAWREAFDIYDWMRQQSKFEVSLFQHGVAAWNLAASLLYQGKTEEAWTWVERGWNRNILDALVMRTATGAGPGAQGVYSRERVQSALPPGSALVGWLETGLLAKEGRYPFWAYVVRTTGPVHWVRVAGPSGLPDSSRIGKLTALVHSLRRAAERPYRLTDASDLTRNAREVYDERIAPLVPFLDGVDHLIVVSSDFLQGLNIEVLIDSSGTPLGDRYAVSYAPSATLFTLRREHPGEHPDPRTWRGLLVGDPVFDPRGPEPRHSPETFPDPSHVVSTVPSDGPQIDLSLQRSVLDGDRNAFARLPRLPLTRGEVEHIAPLLDASKVYLGSQATEDRFRELVRSGNLEDFDLIHIATHALADPTWDLRSALVLSQPDPGAEAVDGLLTRQEIEASWRLQAELVTLSACQTALGPPTWTEGFVGLTQSLLKVGARSVLVSLWKVDDTATSLLMNRFYQNLLGAYRDTRAGRVAEPLPKPEALREAKHWLRTYTDAEGNRPFVHPVYWSAFVLIGVAI